MTDRHHVPAYLRDMFCAALEYGVVQGDGEWWEWFTTEDADRFQWRERDGGRWAHLDAKARAAWVTEQLLGSTAIMPEHVLTVLGFGPGQTYAVIARRVHGEVVGQETLAASASADDALSVRLYLTIPRALLDQVTAISDRMGLTLDDAVRHALTDWVS